MALLMESGSNPLTDNEKADLDAIAALKQESALELKEQGNQFVKKGKNNYSQAIDCYTRAINQKALSNSDTSVLYSNRAHVNLLLGNYRRALVDSEQAIELCGNNIKAYYRAAKAAFSLNLLTEAKSFCERGLEESPSNEEIKKLLSQINTQLKEQEQKKAKISNAVSSAKDLFNAIQNRQLSFAKPAYEELTGVRRPSLDRKSGILHWPVLLLYAESMSSDFIEDFAETDCFSLHLDVMFSESATALPWDNNRAYTRDAVELYYQAGVGNVLKKKDVLRYFLQGSVDSNALSEILSEEIEQNDNETALSNSKNSGKWIKINERKTLLEVLQQKEYIIPAIPVFYVVSNKSSFYKEFKSGKWCPP